MFEYSRLSPLDDEGSDLILSEEEINYVPIFNHENRINLDVPYSDKEIAKYYGARWDPFVRTWFAEISECDLENLQKYTPKNGRKIYKRKPSRRLARILNPQQIVDIQKLLQLSNEEYTDFLLISEDLLVQIKRGEEKIPDTANRILNTIKLFNNHYRSSQFEELFSIFETFETIENAAED